jgi:twitching motility protein PilT
VVPEPTAAVVAPPSNAPWLPADLGPAPGAMGRTVHDTAMNPHSAATFGHEGSALTGRQSTEQTLREEDFSLPDALTSMLDRGASDLHITSGAKPTIRVSGSLMALEDFTVLTPPVLQRVIYSIAVPRTFT